MLINNLTLQIRVKFTGSTLNVEICVDYSSHTFGIQYWNTSNIIYVFEQYFIRHECMSWNWSNKFKMYWMN